MTLTHRLSARPLAAALTFATLAGCGYVEGEDEPPMEEIDEVVSAATAAKVSIPGSAVSASANDGNVPANTVDGNLNTRWSANGDGQWIRYDLGTTRSVAYLRVAFYNGALRVFTFDIQRSSDGTSWTTVASGVKSALNNDRQTFEVTDFSARYVRLVGHGNSTSTWNSMTEVEVWANSSSTPPPSTGPLGSGWVAYAPTKKIHLDDSAGLQTFTWTSSKSVCSPVCADYRYDSATDTETFRILDNRSNRSEIRLQNEYSSGRRQFQGYVRFDAPLDDESLMQVFGSTTGATQLMIRGYAANGGELRGGGKTLSTGCYGVERRVNVIHRQGQDIRIYINGSLKASIADDEAVTNYHKYGVYGTLRTPAVTVRWRAARSYKDGQPPG
jgi:hypothetical protein